MAITTYQDFYGWEPGSDYGISASGTGGAAAIWTLDGTAHTGCYYGKCVLRAAGGNSCTRLFSPPLLLPVNGTSSFDCKARFYMRLAVAPDANASIVMDFGNGAAALPIDMYLRINADLTWELFNNFALPSTVSNGSTFPINTWVLCVAEFNWQRTRDVSDAVRMTLTVGGSSVTSGLLTFGNLLATQPRVDRIALGSISFAGTVGQVDVDDLTVRMQLDTTAKTAGVSLPTADRVRIISIISQGDDADWAGSFTDLLDLPLDPAGPGQISSGAGQATTFRHAPFSAFTFGAIDAVKIYAHLKATVVGPTMQAIRLNGVDYPVAVSNIYETTVAVQMALDWSGYGAIAFDGAQFGVVNVTGVALTLGAIYAEVLYAAGSTNWIGCNNTLDLSGIGGPGHGGGTDPNAIPPACSDGWGVPRLDGLPYVPLLPE